MAALAAEISSRLDDAERTAIYLLLGCGDNYEAIALILKIVQRRDICLSGDATTSLSQWLRGYVESDGEATLRDLINRDPV